MQVWNVDSAAGVSGGTLTQDGAEIRLRVEGGRALDLNAQMAASLARDLVRAAISSQPDQAEAMRQAIVQTVAVMRPGGPL